MAFKRLDHQEEAGTAMQCWIIDDEHMGDVDLWEEHWQFHLPRTRPYCEKHHPRTATRLDPFRDVD